MNEEGDTEKDDQIAVREDFWTSTSDKQLNFVQHIYSLLKIDGRNGRPFRSLRGRGAGRRASRQRSPVKPVAECMAAQLAVERRKESATENIVTEASLKRRSMNEGVSRH